MNFHLDIKNIIIRFAVIIQNLTIMKQRMIEDIKDELAYLNAEVKDISSGGCGIFAITLYKELTKVGFKASLHLVCRNKIEKKDLVDYIKTNQNLTGSTNIYSLMKKSWSHVMVKCNGRLIDSYGVYKSIRKSEVYGSYMITKEAIAPDIMEECSGKDYAYLWNKMYDQSQNDKLISGIIKLVTRLEKYIK